MKQHLTYCLNTHPGETWAENLAAIRTTVLAVRDLVSPGQSFGLGLRLSALAAAELHQPALLAEFKRFLERENLYVFTINGFPFGRFHGGAVKEKVYAPDWRSHERRDYTNQLADILAALLPDGCLGTISTVPGSWKPWIQSPDDVGAMAENLTACADHLARVREDRGREIVLTLEPEPGCYLETTEETVRFFAEDLPASRRHLGVCFDTCHVALQFEDLAGSFRRYQAEDIRVPKIQISSALRTDGGPAALAALAPFAEPVYLHQTLARTSGGERLFWPDLGPALEGLRFSPAAEVRVHFHVPLHFTEAGPLSSTAPAITPEFLILARSCPHLEIETYTWHVLPANLRSGSIEQSIAREFSWVRERLG